MRALALIGHGSRRSGTPSLDETSSRQRSHRTPLCRSQASADAYDTFVAADHSDCPKPAELRTRPARSISDLRLDDRRSSVDNSKRTGTDPTQRANLWRLLLRFRLDGDEIETMRWSIDSPDLPGVDTTAATLANCLLLAS